MQGARFSGPQILYTDDVHTVAIVATVSRYIRITRFIIQPIPAEMLQEQSPLSFITIQFTATTFNEMTDQCQNVNICS